MPPMSPRARFLAVVLLAFVSGAGCKHQPDAAQVRAQAERLADTLEKPYAHVLNRVGKLLDRYGKLDSETPGYTHYSLRIAELNQEAGKIREMLTHIPERAAANPAEIGKVLEAAKTEVEDAMAKVNGMIDAADAELSKLEAAAKPQPK
jgi:hypothetical protein